MFQPGNHYCRLLLLDLLLPAQRDTKRTRPGCYIPGCRVHRRVDRRRYVGTHQSAAERLSYCRCLGTLRWPQGESWTDLYHPKCGNTHYYTGWSNHLRNPLSPCCSNRPPRFSHSRYPQEYRQNTEQGCMRCCLQTKDKHNLHSSSEGFWWGHLLRTLFRNYRRSQRCGRFRKLMRLRKPFPADCFGLPLDHKKTLRQAVSDWTGTISQTSHVAMYASD